MDTDLENDRIDIYAKPDVSVKISDGDVDNEIKILLKGKSIDHSVSNAIRITVNSSIPAYAFYRTNIFIDNEKTKCKFNNDQLYNIIETLPIFNISHDLDLEDPELYLPKEIIDSIFGTFTKKTSDDTKNITPKKMLNIELSINFKNTTGKDIYVNTHHVVLKVNGKINDSYKKRKYICLFLLEPGQEIHMRAEATVGIEKIHAAYDVASNAIHKEYDSMTYELCYEAIGPLDKKEIFRKACTILIKKFENLKNFISENYVDEPDTKSMDLVLYGEKYPVGYSLATVLQKCDLTTKAGFAEIHNFVDDCLISFEVTEKYTKKKNKVLVDCISYLIGLYSMILEKFNKIA